MTITNYPLGDFLIRVKNAALSRRKEVVVKESKLVFEVAKVLNKNGYLDGVSKKDGNITVSLAFRKKEPVILDIKLVSTPGLRVYTGVSELEAKKGPSAYLLSTPKGVLTSKDAIKMRIGGEVLVELI